MFVIIFGLISFIYCGVGLVIELDHLNSLREWLGKWDGVLFYLGVCIFSGFLGHFFSAVLSLSKWGIIRLEKDDGLTTVMHGSLLIANGGLAAFYVLLSIKEPGIFSLTAIPLCVGLAIYHWKKWSRCEPLQR